jgi:hypothetical protein
LCTRPEGSSIYASAWSLIERTLLPDYVGQSPELLQATSAKKRAGGPRNFYIRLLISHMRSVQGQALHSKRGYDRDIIGQALARGLVPGEHRIGDLAVSGGLVAGSGGLGVDVI